MLSPRGGRPHDAIPAPAPSSSSKPSRHTGLDPGRVLEWEAGLPAAAELTPLSHPLIPRALAAAFRIDVAGPYSFDSSTSHLSFRCDDEDDDDDGNEEGETVNAAPGGEAHPGEKVRKKSRMVWTADLHRQFVEAVVRLGDKGAVPKAIVRLMDVKGITRENVASHLQKYRLYLKRTRTQPSLPPAHGSPFSPQRPSDKSNRSGYCVSLARDDEKLKRNSRLQEEDGPAV